MFNNQIIDEFKKKLKLLESTQIDEEFENIKFIRKYRKQNSEVDVNKNNNAH